MARQRCTQCGKTFERLKSHITKAHGGLTAVPKPAPGSTPDEEPSLPDPEDLDQGKKFATKCRTKAAALRAKAELLMRMATEAESIHREE